MQTKECIQLFYLMTELFIHNQSKFQVIVGGRLVGKVSVRPARQVIRNKKRDRLAASLLKIQTRDKIVTGLITSPLV